MDLSNNIVKQMKIGEFDVLKFRRLLDLGINNAYVLKPWKFNTRPEVVSKERFLQSVENYKNLLNSMGLDYNKLIKCNQTHTNNVAIVKELTGNANIEGEPYTNTDGLITNMEDAILATTNADCILLLFYDPIRNVIANVHSGWRGTFSKIAVNTVAKMVNEYGCNPSDIVVCICPSIRKCHFNVKSDVEQMCREIFGYTNRIDDIIEYVGKDEAGDDSWKIDTVLITKILLLDCGIRPENIEDCGICSVCNSEYVNSKRADGERFGLGTAILTLKR